MTDNKIYFPSLNGIRFLAAFSVIVVHIEQIKIWMGIRAFTEDEFFLAKLVLDGDDAVTLFFVLSGFLITYLLLTENARAGHIQVQKFYLRRALRIWPLYYLILLLGFVGLPLFAYVVHFRGYVTTVGAPADPIWVLWAYLFFLTNLTYFGSIYPMGLSHLWSIGIEEQYYLTVPVLLKKFARNVAPVLCFVIGFKVLLVFVSDAYQPPPDAPAWMNVGDVVLRFLVFWRVENMAVGGLGAYVLFSNRQRILNLLFHPISQKIVLALMLGNVFLYNGRQPLMNQALSVVYIVFILNVACNPQFLLKLESRAFNELGRIAYGIYMYHIIIIHVVLMLFPGDNGFLYNLFLYPLVIGLTVGIAWLSYTYFEQPFLLLKRHFTVIESSDKPVEAT
jgi:peptidoglycan/LPS O-acetylase OafA/YrhL